MAGVVQGVGFRPFVHRLATELDLAGHVGNDSEGVFVEVEGDAAVIERFRGAPRYRMPRRWRGFGPSRPLRQICSARTASASSRAVSSGAARTFVSPDVAVCGDCLAELFDPADRRYRYPFVNCTNCGPRFTITVRLPYDRPNTTMAGFPLCPACAGEYDDPADRRFHAQPIACPACGPRLWFESPAGTLEGTDAAIGAAQAALAAGGIVAVKGLGGYHLACDATSQAALGELRRRKHRADKPFAVMVADLASAEPARRRRPAGGGAPARARSGPIVLLGEASGRRRCRRSWRPATPASACCFPTPPSTTCCSEPFPARPRRCRRRS